MKVRAERSQRKICLSAISDRSLADLLKEIIRSEIYKADYENRTVMLLTDSVSYKEAIGSVSEIICKLDELDL